MPQVQLGTITTNQKYHADIESYSILTIVKILYFYKKKHIIKADDDLFIQQ